MKKIITILIAVSMTLGLCACRHMPMQTSGAQANIKDTKDITDKLTSGQQTPTDIDYSLERYNLIRRAYWVNGQREKADMLVCPVIKPLGYIILFVEGCGVVGQFVVDGKVSSLNSFLSPDYEENYYGDGNGGYTTVNTQLADVDGSYGENDSGIFFFTPDGQYKEWTGTYLYGDAPFELNTPTILQQEEN